MPLNYAPTPVADTKLTSRTQEFELALERYIRGYREAQIDRRALPAAQRSLILPLALTERGTVGSHA